ncbi:uncharacterized protein BO66DRAFT_123443 [Aspergillus aculeatinus CBS 121060]|uniref:Uncharacterized protein n=1 Tax=Aspergillus aculeatinus CBS 121060 TaxID=1448322 RepID=A0ACD1H5G1_9EURO|nr:hypothetical protein BO66DRAFT_123443 [Aspergillus aculeatinus CBS 121060]RAH68645.1 hypothetical protein BO66DRAFT_123443 [Aspergillus aculeatinus CBS 121060]
MKIMRSSSSAPFYEASRCSCRVRFNNHFFILFSFFVFFFLSSILSFLLRVSNTNRRTMMGSMEDLTAWANTVINLINAKYGVRSTSISLWLRITLNKNRQTEGQADRQTDRQTSRLS